MNQPQQQQQKPKEEWKPTGDTIFLLLSDTEFVTRARAHLTRKFGKVRMQTEINTQKLSDRNTVVCVYQDPDRDVVDASTGQPRPRKPGKRSPAPGIPGEKAEPPDVLVGAPIECSTIWLDGGENDAGVQVKNLMSETGQIKKGLISLLADTCRPCVMKHREDINEVKITTV